MACQFYNNGGLGGCAGCCHFNKSLLMALSGDVLEISIGPQVLKNKEKVCVALCQNIPDGVGPDTTVSIVVEGTSSVTLPVMLRDGNHLYGDQLRTRKVLHLETATDVPSFVLVPPYCVCPTDHSFPTINTEAPAPPVQSAAQLAVVKGGSK